MNSNFTEESLVQQPTIEVFKSLGYSYQHCFNEFDDPTFSIGRETKSEVVLKDNLRSALLILNPTLPNEAIEKAILDITSNRSILNPANANRETYKLLKDGVKVVIRNNNGDQEEKVVKVIDFKNPEHNDFFLASELWITGDTYTRTADLVGFVNGLPLIFMELKAVHNKLDDAFYKNITDYKDTIPQAFWYNAFIIISNGSESRVGTISSQYEHFAEWKRINNEGEQGVVSLDTIIKGLCEKSRFLDLLENFIIYQETGGSLIKIFSKNHQYLGVNNVIEKFSNLDASKGRLGVFWHTQGSGKSFSMIFFTQKILRNYGGNYTFVIVTDRKELDGQIYKNFANCGAVTEVEVHAESRAHLKQLLTENHRNIFTLVHKFGTNTDEVMEVISDRKDIIVITDEAHRSQYDTLALNMRIAMPNASFLAFTGTPLIDGEELTKDTFGDYVSVYDFKQSIEDRATVPLYYENRIPELQLDDKDLFDEKIQDIIEAAELDDAQERKLEREFSREYHLITREDRLNKIANDIVEHFMGRGYKGKAMMVCIDKPTAVKMYDKVKDKWATEISKLEDSVLVARDNREREIISDRLKYMQETEMAVIVSQEQNEIKKFNDLGLDIETHRKRMVNENMDEKFKDPEDPFRIVFVCAMWMTGFDAPSVSTIYLDKPMKNHTLMQTIARANRVFQDKPNGLIVDYIGIFRNLEKALAIYGTGSIDDGITPVKSKDVLVKDLAKEIKATKTLCKNHDVVLDDIQAAEALVKIKLIDEAVNLLVANDKIKNNYLAQANYVQKLFKAILPDPLSNTFLLDTKLIKVIADKIRSLNPTPDITEVMKSIAELLDESVKTEGYLIKETPEIDLTKIDFKSLKKMFEKGKKFTQAEKLKNALQHKIAVMIQLNKGRMDFAEKLQEMIDEYNAGSSNVEEFFDKLMKFAKDLNEEESRGIKEQLSEEELALFDILKKQNLSEKDKTKVKIAAKELLTKLKAGRLVLDWRKRQQTRASVLLAIEEALDENLPVVYTPELYKQKCQYAYEHIYENYFGDGRSIYN
ncbi:MAG: type I restriction endonuclease subunit R [Ignavibacteriae bacterium]|nr:type I restriction endonuclease subunit R [Ignavibacteriota bacterium]